MDCSDSPQPVVQKAVKTVRQNFIEDDSRSVDDALMINSGYCRPFAEEVLDRLRDVSGVTRQDAWDVHSWIEVNGRHYDAETPRGVCDPHRLPIWARLSAGRQQTAVEASDVLSAARLPK
jgi:hypothetical protein